MKRYVCKNNPEIKFVIDNYINENYSIESYKNYIFFDDNKFSFTCPEDCYKCTSRKGCRTENFENIIVADLIRKDKFKMLLDEL